MFGGCWLSQRGARLGAIFLLQTSLHRAARLSSRSQLFIRDIFIANILVVFLFVARDLPRCTPALSDESLDHEFRRYFFWYHRVVLYTLTWRSNTNLPKLLSTDKLVVCHSFITAGFFSFGLYDHPDQLYQSCGPWLSDADCGRQWKSTRNLSRTECKPEHDQLFCRIYSGKWPW